MTDETKPQILTPEQRDLLTHEQRCEVDTAHHPALLRKLVEEFKAGKTKPRVIPLHLAYADECGIEEIKEYFHGAKRRFGSAKHPIYRQLVAQWEKANGEYLKQPPKKRLSFPLIPPLKPEDRQTLLCVKEMPALSEIVPHTGGRPRSPSVSKRDELIRECKAKGMSDEEICQVLDNEGIVPPQHWEAPKGKRPWSFLRRNDPRVRGLIHRLFSKVARKAKRSP